MKERQKQRERKGQGKDGGWGVWGGGGGDRPGEPDFLWFYACFQKHGVLSEKRTHKGKIIKYHIGISFFLSSPPLFFF